MSRWVTLLLISMLSIVAACQRPFDRSPDGYTAACLGTPEGPLSVAGREIAKRNSVCSDDRLRISAAATREDWPDLTNLVTEFGRSRALRMFDTSVQNDQIQSLELHLCSPEGVHILVHKRIYKEGPADPDPSHIPIMFLTYEKKFDWKPLADELVAAFKEKWQRPMEISWPEPIPPAERALPDSVASCDS